MTFKLDRQNDREALRFRAAADRYYGIVGRARWAELFIVGASVALGLIASAAPNLQVDAAFWGIVLAFIDATVVYDVIITNRHAAAQLSDCFDRYLFSNAPETRFPCSRALDCILTQAEKLLSERSVVERVSNWYDGRLGGLPRSAAHLAALRINAFWDASLRGPYVVIISAIAAAIAIAAAYLFLRNGYGTDRLVINVLVPFAPALLWFAREWVDQSDARARKAEFQREVESLWDRTPTASESEQVAAVHIERLQALLFSYRRTDVSVPWWLYRITRNRLHHEVEALMDCLLPKSPSAAP